MATQPRHLYRLLTLLDPLLRPPAVILSEGRHGDRVEEPASCYFAARVGPAPIGFWTDGLRSAKLEDVPSPLPALIFDLDGTLTDSKPGILGCLGKVIAARKIDPQGPLDRFVGPPIEEWAAALLPGESEAARASLARDYRACYDREGWKNNSVFAGVREMLAELRQRGFPLYVCTSKGRHFAARILDYFELAGMFTAIYGDEAEYASHSKADLLARLLGESSQHSDSAWMIGDRVFDFQAARANHIRCLAAGWGYGSPQEYALADAVAAAPQDVPALVLPGIPR